MAEEQNQPVISQLQKKVDNIKAVAMLQGSHNLTPPAREDDDKNALAIVKALESEPLIKAKIMDLMGYMENPLKPGDLVQIRPPVMNMLGIGNMVTILRNIARDYEFSSLKEEEIPQRTNYLFKYNYPQFTMNYIEYELDKKDLNIIATYLFSTIDAILHKARNSGHRNVVRGTYSEELAGKMITADQQRRSGMSDMLSMFNPFGGKKR